jgi:hypothetical protein
MTKNAKISPEVYTRSVSRVLRIRLTERSETVVLDEDAIEVTEVSIALRRASAAARHVEIKQAVPCDLRLSIEPRNGLIDEG